MADPPDHRHQHVRAVALGVRSGTCLRRLLPHRGLPGHRARHIFTHPLRLVLVAVGVVIGTLVIPALSGDAWQAFRRGDTVAAMILVGAVVLSWLLKRRLETGRRVVGVRPLDRRRRSRRR